MTREKKVRALQMIFLLPDDLRYPTLYRFEEGLSYEAIGRALGITPELAWQRSVDGCAALMAENI